VTEPARTLDDICPSRRAVFQGLLALGGVALVPGVLTACSSGDGGGSGSDDSAGEGGGGSIPAADVAVGTAVVVELGGEKVVVAQPTEGEYAAFSAKCTHEGTDVEAGDGLQLTCPNHGSQYDAADGAAVLKGPATSPLRALDVKLDGDQLVIS
jgi:Rieske Fe-S protein